MTPDQLKQLFNSFNNQDNATLIETHISFVIITSSYAYKIKKPVKNSFLDFSTIELRKTYCFNELQLNQRFTSGIYLQVLPVTENSGLVEINGAGKTIDYVLKMKTLPQEKLMTKLLKEGKVRSEEIENLAGIISGFHNTASIINTAFSPENLYENFADIRQIVPLIEDHHEERYLNIINESLTTAQRFIFKNKDVFILRINKGFVRDLHGDLHSGNIFLTAPPVLFDCIEYKAEFRTIDVLHEIAFLCMDLEYFSRKDFSNLLLKKYLEGFPCLSSEADQQLFLFYKIFRANVRAKVSALQTFSGTGLNPEVKKYLDLMDKYILELKGI
ncbi:MAG: hypothetical protein ACK4ND_04040 [Cytophagaceae bacterium]